MKRINEYKKLFNVDKEIDLKTLKTTYRNLVKEWHPDKFQSGDDRATEAETKSRQIIDGYHNGVWVRLRRLLPGHQFYRRGYREN